MEQKRNVATWQIFGALVCEFPKIDLLVKKEKENNKKINS